MTTVPQTAARPRVGVVSYTLALTVSARRVAARFGADPAPFVKMAVRTYRATGDRFEALRALRDFVALCQAIKRTAQQLGGV